MSEQLSENVKTGKKILGELLYQEGKWLLMVLALLFISLRIVFFQESFLSTLRITISLFGMFVLPGWALTYYWKEKLKFLERIVVGIAVSSAVLGIASYYFGLLGWAPKSQGYVLPMLLFMVGMILVWWKEKKNGEKL